MKTKFYFFTIVLSSIVSLSARAQDLTIEDQVRNLNANMLDVQRRLNHVEHNGGGGGHNGPGREVTSAVKPNCIFEKWQTTNNQTQNLTTAAKWAERCRNAPANQEGCRVLDFTTDNNCKDAVRRCTNYATLTADQADQLDEACNTVKLSCDF